MDITEISVCDKLHSTNFTTNIQRNAPICKPSDYAVRISNLCKRYQKGPSILQNFSMAVETGTIYALLGSSGCGKTTVLSCIAGLVNWNSGQVMVFGRKPNLSDGHKLGYMPQDVSLYSHLRIHEIIQFYGELYHIEKEKLMERWLSLQKLLDLRNNLKQIKELSGGMKRRVSLALALIHSPKLLVLDEPTVGLDPLLRENIWHYLQNLATNSGTTILITTHYTDEARLANTIGVMRSGRLIAEEAPGHVLEHSDCFTFDEAILKLCQRDQAQLKNLSFAPCE